MKKILVVEDDASLRFVIRMVLEKHGYEVSEATHGGEALDQMETVRPDLVLADLRMPGLGGRELVARMRASADLCSIPVGLLSGDPGMTGAQLGADFLVVKPFEPAELVRAIEGAISPR